MFYEYRQNNSGGWFQVEYKIDCYVVIEAPDEAQANEVAKRVGLYFDGIESGLDCECCGPRWFGVTDESEVPSRYGEPFDVIPAGTVIHYADGRIGRPGERVAQPSKEPAQEEPLSAWSRLLVPED